MTEDEKIKPLDKLLEEKIGEFESGTERELDKELDKMIWELGDYETQEAPQEAGEFQEEAPMEEELVEKKLRVAGKDLASFTEPGPADENLPAGEKLPDAVASGLGTEEAEEE